MATLKRPAPKAATAPVRQVAKAATKPAAKVVPDLPVLNMGNVLTFKGYSTERAENEVVFNAADKPKVAIVAIEEDPERGTVYTVVPVEDYWAYRDQKEEGVGDDDLKTASGEPLVGDTWIEGEFTRGRFNKDNNTYPSVPERELPVEIAHIGKMEELLADHDGNHLELAVALVNEAEQSLFYAGGALAHIKDTKEFATYQDPDKEQGQTYSNDGSGWQKFIGDNFPPGFGWRKCEGYIAIYKRVSMLSTAENVVSRLNDVGYSKAEMISGHMTDENASELVEAAASQSISELRTTLAEKYVSDTGKNAAGKSATRVTVKMESITFKYFEDQAIGVKYILDAAKKKLGLDDNQALEHILQEWATDHLGADEAQRASSRVAARRKQFISQKVTLPKDHPLAIAQRKAIEGDGPATNGATTPKAALKSPADAKKLAAGLTGKRAAVAPASA